MKKLFIITALSTVLFAACSDCDDCTSYVPGTSDSKVEVLVFNTTYTDDFGCDRPAIVAVDPDDPLTEDGTPKIRLLLDGRAEFEDGLGYGSIGSDGKTLLFSAACSSDECYLTYSYHIPDGRLRLIIGYRGGIPSRELSDHGPVEYERGFRKPLFAPSMKEIYGLQYNLLSAFSLETYLKTPLLQDDYIFDYSVADNGKELYIASSNYCQEPIPEVNRIIPLIEDAGPAKSIITRLPAEGRNRKMIKEIENNVVISIDRVPGYNKVAYTELTNYDDNSFPDPPFDGTTISTVTFDGQIDKLYPANQSDLGDEAMLSSLTVNRNAKRFAWIEYKYVDESESIAIMMADYNGTSLSNADVVINSLSSCYYCISSVRFSMINKDLFNTLPLVEDCGTCQ